MIRHIPRAARTGATLLGAVLVLGSVACADDPAPLFEVPGSGSLEGFLFLDNDADGRFDPSSGDQALSNVGLRLLERGTSATISGSETSTNAAGRFQLAGVRVGSHDLVIDTAGLGESVFFCQNPVPVNVFLGETQFREVAARGGCVITIAEAELQPIGTAVTVRGTITSAPGMINDRTAAIQDASGGTPLFRFVGTPELQVGDIAEVTGTLDQFSGEFEIVDVRVVSVTAGEPLEPKLMTTGAADATWADPRHPDQGRLIRVEGARMLTVFDAGGGRNATFNDNSGDILVRVEAGLQASPDDIDARFTVGSCYNITGILRGFNADAQIMPRTYADIQEVPCQG